MFTTARALRAGMTNKALAHLVAAITSTTPGTRGVTASSASPRNRCWTSPPRLVSAIPKRFQTRATPERLATSTWNDAVVSPSDRRQLCLRTLRSAARHVRFSPSTLRAAASGTLRSPFTRAATKPQWGWSMVCPPPQSPRPSRTYNHIANENQDHLGRIIYDAILRRGEPARHRRRPDRRPPTTAGSRPSPTRVDPYPADFIAANDLLDNLGRT